MRGLKKSSKKSLIKTIIAMVVLGGLILSTFVYLSNREDKAKAEIGVEQTEVEKLLEADLNKEYPPTAREVLKRYARIVKSVHSEELSDEVVTKLGDTILLLYSEELIKANPREEYVEKLLSEVKEYEKIRKKVTSYAIDSGEYAVTWKENGIEFTRILVTFTTQEDTVFNRTTEEFVLKKDSKDQWKILGWRLASKEDM